MFSRRVEDEVAERLKNAKENLGILLDVALRVRETYIQRASISMLLLVSGKIDYEYGYISALYRSGLARREDFEEAVEISFLHFMLRRLITEKNLNVGEYFWGWQCLKCGARIPLSNAPRKADTWSPRRHEGCRGTLAPVPAKRLEEQAEMWKKHITEAQSQLIRRQ